MINNKSFWHRNLNNIIVSLFTSLFINFTIIYLAITENSITYFDFDELIWIKQVSFCGGEFTFYEQKWGLIVPLLCIIYPLKLIIGDYYFAVFSTTIIRFIAIFLNSFLFLKLLEILLKKRSAILFVFFSNFTTAIILAGFIYSISRVIIGKADELPKISEVAISIIGVPNSPGRLFLEISRIFNPSFFLTFFLLFSICFVKFLDSPQENKRKYKLLSGVALGVLYYSTLQWWLYANLSVLLMLIYLIITYPFSKNQENKQDIKSTFEILILGALVASPALILNYLQTEMVGESIKRAAIFIKIPHAITSQPRIYITFLLISVAFFLLSRNFAKKNIFILLSTLCGFSLYFFQEIVTGISLQLPEHIQGTFKMFGRICIGFFIDKIANRSRLAGYILAGIMFSGFSYNWYLFFHSSDKDSLSEKTFLKLINWIKNNTEKDAVIISEETNKIYEIKISATTGRYTFHNLMNYFSDLSSNEVFERFLIKQILIGKNQEEIINLIKEFRNTNQWLRTWEARIWYFQAYFGLPKGVSIPSSPATYNDYEKFEGEVIQKIIEVLSNKESIVELMKKYRIDVIVRKNPKDQKENYLEEIQIIDDFYILKYINK